MDKCLAGVEPKNRILFLHDNHFVVNDGVPSFKGSTFHHLLAGFEGSAHLSSPSLNLDCKCDSLQIDGAVIRPRCGYGRAQGFYRRFISNAACTFVNLLRIYKDYDAVVIAGPCCSAPIAYLAAKVRRKPVIGYVIGNNLEVIADSQEYSGLRKLMARMAAEWEWLAMKRIVKCHQSIVLGEGLCSVLSRGAKGLTLGFTSLVREQSIIPRKRFMASGKLSLLTVGRVSQEKGIEWALHAVAELRERGVPLSYTVVGTGPDMDRLKQLAEDIGVAPQVHFLGARQFAELPAYYQQADIFILPSHSEGVAKVLLEAMAARESIVATSVGGNPWVLGDGERGRLVPYGDSRALADAVCDLMVDNAGRSVSGSCDGIH